MRIWDVPPGELDRAALLGEHRELHAIWTILVEDRHGYRRHPEVLRWQGRLGALYARHEAEVAEMHRRGYRHASPLDRRQVPADEPLAWTAPPPLLPLAEQRRRLAGKAANRRLPDADHGPDRRVPVGGMEGPPRPCQTPSMNTRIWGPALADVYDVTTAEMFEPSVLGPTVNTLFALAEGGPALEFAIGTGRVALPLRERGIDVAGIELSPHMAERLRAKAGAARIALTIGDMTEAKARGTFRLVYLVFNTIMNVTSQDGQVAVFRNARAHLRPGGRFVVEVGVPPLRRLPRGERGLVFDLSDHHVGIDTFDDVATQITWSHHLTLVDGQLHRDSAPYRYVWPPELDLMAQLAGLVPEYRWCDWERTPFGPESERLVAVYRRPGRAPGAAAGKAGPAKAAGGGDRERSGSGAPGPLP